MGLILVGTGLWDERDISLRGLDALKQSDIIYAERYTSEKKEGTLERLEALCGKGITVLSREEVEEGKRIMDEAERRKVSLVVAGDPMISTTHVSLKLEAHRRGIPFKVIHSSSILSAAISESGLHTYKFGRPVTLPFWSEKYKPTTTYDVIRENSERGLHTLLFLDLKDGVGMRAHEAFSLLRKMEKEKKCGVISDKTMLVTLSRVGSEEQKVAYGPLELLEKAELGEAPFIMIVLGKLHFTEEEALGIYAVK